MGPHISSFTLWLKQKKFSDVHYYKCLRYAIHTGKNTHFFTYSEILKLKDKLTNDGYFKGIRSLCNFFEEKYPDNTQLLAEIVNIRKAVKKPKCNADIYTPSDDEMLANLKLLKKLKPEFHKFFLGLAFSGVRINELEAYINSPEKFRIVTTGAYKKVILNLRRRTKNCLFIYLPRWYEPPDKISIKYLNRFLQLNKEIIRPKYMRNWFYSKCLDLEIPSGIADFYQGRSPVTVGDRHYLDKEKMADRLYAEKLEPYFKSRYEP
ncbi:integrase [Nanoarchaeota archaeon]